jgi:hypothetical protein
MKTDSPASAPKNAAHHPTRLRAIAVTIAVVLTSLLWLATRILDVDLVVNQRNGRPPMTIGLPMISGFTLT